MVQRSRDLLEATQAYMCICTRTWTNSQCIEANQGVDVRVRVWGYVSGCKMR